MSRVDYETVTAEIRRLLNANQEAWPDDATMMENQHRKGYASGLLDLAEALSAIKYPRGRK